MSNVPSPLWSTCTVLFWPSAEVVVTVWPEVDPSTLRSVTVRVRLPSALTTVSSSIPLSKVPSPSTSTAVNFDKPSGENNVTVWSIVEPSAARSVRVSVMLPSAAVWRVSDWPMMPLPSRSRSIVTLLPSAEVVVVVLSSSTPEPLVSLTVSVLLPSAPTTVSSVCRRSMIPLPASSKAIVLVSPSAEMVEIVSVARLPSECRVALSIVVEPSGFTVISGVSSTVPLASCAKVTVAAVPVEPSVLV